MSPFCCASLLVMWLAVATTGSTGGGVSDFYVRKMKTLFQRLDMDKDGILEVKDYRTIFKLISKNQNLGGEVDKQFSEDDIQKVWKAFKYDMNKTGDPLTQEEFLESMAKRHEEPEYLEELKILLKLVFDALDYNADGVLEPKEHFIDSKSFGLNPEEAEVSFNAFDSDQGGSLSFDELFSVSAEYWTDEEGESKPNRLIYGPLVS